MLFDEEYRHGGGAVGAGCTDMSINVNPLGTPDFVINAIRESAALVHRYPDAKCRGLLAGISKMYGLPPEYVICGNGADELIYNYAAAMEAGSIALIYAPAFAEYERALMANKADIRFHITGGAQNVESPIFDNDFKMQKSDIKDEEIECADTVIVCMPSNPAGQLIDRDVLEYLLVKCRTYDTACLLDISFYELTDEFDESYIAGLVNEFPNLCVLSSFTKTYAIAGLRLGYMLCSDARLIRKISSWQPCWNVSLAAQYVGEECLKHRDYVEESRRFIRREREYLYDNLLRCVSKVCKSQANYILFYEPQLDCSKLLSSGIKIRDCSDYVGLGKGFFRTCVGSHEDNEKLIKIICGKGD